SENNLSEGTDEAGIARYLRACLAWLGSVLLCNFHQLSGFSVLYNGSLRGWVGIGNIVEYNCVSFCMEETSSSSISSKKLFRFEFICTVSVILAESSVSIIRCTSVITPACSSTLKNFSFLKRGSKYEAKDPIDKVFCQRISICSSIRSLTLATIAGKSCRDIN